MSGLTVLLLVLPFPLAFVIHDLEEILFQHRWMLKNKESLSERFPKLRKLIDNLARMNTKAFSVAVLEELLVLLAVTAYVLCQGEYAKEAWVAVFIAFSFHLIVHVIQ
ncbi:MAG: HXXEE domain-containing protein, partial [Bacteroidales bacterium]|nr:HXXEE domain-containing protein [Bacteroidales bacterium]